MKGKKTLIPFMVIVLLIGLLLGGIPGALAGFQPGTGETTKINLMDVADPTAAPVTYPDGQQYIELNDTYTVGDTFTVWANVTSVTELNMYQVGVTYNDTILTCTSYSEGEFFYRADAQYRTNPINHPILADGSGFLGWWNHVTWVLAKPGHVSGNGTLAVFVFTVVGWGFTYIDIIISGGQEAFLISSGPPYNEPPGIPFNTVDIVFDNTGLAEDHELTVSVEAPDMVKPGESSLLNATVYNKGLNDETNVELQLLIDGTVKESETITDLLTGSSYTIDYTWTPTVGAKYTYNVTAYAVPVSGETDTDNNVATKFVTLFRACIDHSYVYEDVTYYVGTCSNGSVSDIDFSKLFEVVEGEPKPKLIFNLSSTEAGKYWVWCNVTIPKELLYALPDRWIVESSGQFPHIKTITENDTHTSIYFLYTHWSTLPSEVVITGTEVIPEFPAAMFLLLFMMVTLVVVILVKSTKRRKAIGK